jgi:hypothetical protein
MAFLAPFVAKGAATGLGTGLKIGTTIGLKASPSVLAPVVGSTLPTGSLLTAGGGGLGGLGGAGGSLLTGGGLGGASGLLGGSGALLPKFASLGGKGGSLLSGTGGLGTLKSGADLAAFGGKTLSPGQLEYLRAASASTNPNLVSSNLLPGPTDYVKQFLGTSGPTGPSTQTLLGGGQNISTGTNYLLNAPPKELVSLELSQGANLANAVKSGGLRMPTGMETGLQLTPEAAQTALVPKGSPVIKGENFLTNAKNFFQNPSLDAAGDYLSEHPYASAGAAYMAYNALKPKPKGPEKDVALIRPYDFDYNPNAEAYATSPTTDSSERLYFSPTFTAQTPYEAPGPEYKRAAEGGVMGLAVGGPVETMSAMNAIGGNMQYPQAGLHTALYSNPMMQRPESVNVISPGEGPAVGAYSGEQKFAMGGLSDLGGYSDGGRLLKGPGDGVSDSIPAVIGNRQPARLADGEFVIPARIVSEIGNGSTEAGARKLYAMMDRVQKARRKTVGKGKVAANTKADKYLPA